MMVRKECVMIVQDEEEETSCNWVLEQLRCFPRSLQLRNRIESIGPNSLISPIGREAKKNY